MNDSDDLNSKTDYLQRPDFQHHKFLLYGRDALYKLGRVFPVYMGNRCNGVTGSLMLAPMPFSPRVQ